MAEQHREALLQRARSLIELGRHKEALGPLGLALAKSPEDTDALFQMARCYFRMGDMQKAEEVNLSNLRIDSNNGWGLYLHSLIMHKQLRFDKELELAEQACRISPEEPYFLQRLAEAQMQGGMTKRARKTADQLLAVDPNSDVAHEILASLNFDLERWPDCEKHCLEALRHDPEDTGLQHNLAVALYQQKKFSDAIEVLSAAMQQDPSNRNIQKRLHEAIKSHLGVSTGVARANKLSKLPDVAKVLFEDINQRTTWWQKHSLTIIALGWVVVGAIIVWFLDANGIGSP